MLGPKSKLRFILGACNSRDSTSPNEITPAHCVKVSLLMEVQESIHHKFTEANSYDPISLWLD